MKNITNLFFLAFAIFLFSCTSPEPTALVFDKAKALAEINAANDHFVKTMSAHDHAAHAACYTKDALFMVPGKPSIVGRTAIEADAIESFKSGVTELGLTTTEIYDMGGDMLLEEGKFTISNKEGITFDKGKYLVLWKKEEGKWKLHRDIYNSDNPPPAPPCCGEGITFKFDLSQAIGKEMRLNTNSEGRTLPITLPNNYLKCGTKKTKFPHF